MMKLYRILLVLFAGLLFQACTKEVVSGESDSVSGDMPGFSDSDIVDGWVRIKLEESTPQLRTAVFTRGGVDTGNSALDEVAAQLGATEIRRVFPEAGKFEARQRKAGLHLWYDVKIDKTVAVSRAAGQLALIPGVAHVEPVYKIKVIEAGSVPMDAVYMPASYGISAKASENALFNDPLFEHQWNLSNDGSLQHSVAGADINAVGGWKITAGDPDVIVAILDSGVQYDHPDLAANMWINEAELNGTPGVDDDNNGFVDDVYGWNFMEKSYGPTITPGSHATHVAGIVAAVNNNNEGVCGIAGGTGNNDGVKIMTLQAYTDSENGDPDAFPAMFAYAANNGAVIAQCSWVYSQDSMSEALSDAIDYFDEYAGTDENGNQSGPMKGGLCIFGAGNTGTGKVFYPAKDPRVIGVVAMTADYAIAAYSNYGEGADLVAPGGTNIYPDIRDLYILSTYPDGKYGYMAGTSMATPHVAGVAGLIISKFKGVSFTAADLKAKLLRSYRPVGEYVDQKYNGKVGWGLVDASLILTEVPEGGPVAIVGAKAESAPAALVVVCPVPLDGNDMPVAKFNLKYAEKVNGTEGKWTELNLINTYPAGTDFKYTLSLKSEASYSLQMNAVDRYGRETAYVNFEGTTLHYANNAPVIKKVFPDVSIAKADPSLKRFFLLSEYFSDPDATYGDVLTYTVETSNDKIVTVDISNNNKMVNILPIAKGACVVTVTATDSQGASVESIINVTVVDGPDPGEDPNPDPDPDPDPKPEPDNFPAGLSLYPNPVVNEVNYHIKDAANASVSVEIFDAAARMVSSGKMVLDKNANVKQNVSSLAPGSYKVVIRSNGQQHTAVMIKR